MISVQSDPELRSQQQANVRIKEVELPKTLIFNYYNKIVRIIQNLPSNGQLRDILAKDDNIQRLLKQQLNDSLERIRFKGKLHRDKYYYSLLEPKRLLNRFN